MGKLGLSNTNKLIRTYKGATGLKTGSTSLALYNLSASATRDGLSLIAVIMKAPSTKVRFQEAAKLLDYGFNNYSYKELGKKGDIVKSVIINKGTKNSLDVILENDVGILLKKGEESNITQTLNLSDIFYAPITSGQRLGTMTFEVNGNTLASVNLVASSDVEKDTLFNMSKETIYNWLYLLRN